MPLLFAIDYMARHKNARPASGRHGTSRHKVLYAQIGILLIVLGALMIIQGAALLPSGNIIISPGGITPSFDWRFFKHDTARTGQTGTFTGGPDSAAALWIFDTGTGKPIEGSPVTCKGNVIFGSADGHVYAIGNATGQLVWQYPAAGDTAIGAVYGSPACPGDGRIYFGSDDTKIRAIKESDGSLAWQYQTGAEIKGSQIVSGDAVYAGSLDNYAYALNSTTGVKLWRTGLDQIYGGPALNGNEIITADQVCMSRLKLADGSIIQQDCTSNVYTPGRTTPAIDTKNGYIYAGDDDNQLVARNITNLTDNSDWTFTTGGFVRSSPVISTDSKYVFFGSDDGKLYAVHTGLAGTAGLKLWSFDTGAPLRGTPAVDSSRIYFAARNGTVYALNISTGSVAWSYDSSSQMNSSPAISSQKLYIGTEDGKMFAITTVAIADKTAPTWSNQKQDSDTIGLGGTVKLSVDLADNYALGSATLSTNETGAWVNYTNTYGSTVALAGKSSTANFTWSNANVLEGNTVKWKVYFKDAAAVPNEAVTGEKSFKVVGDITPPTPSNINQRNSEVVLGGGNELKALWTDDSGLLKAELLIGGTKVDEVQMQNKESWSNFTYTPLALGAVSWQIRGTDGAGNTANTPTNSFYVVAIATDTTPPVIGQPEISATEVAAGELVNIKLTATDNIALNSAEFEVDGQVVDRFDFIGAPTGKAAFAYTPPEPGIYTMRITVSDTAGNKQATPDFTITATTPLPAPTCLLPIPRPSNYTACKLEPNATNGTQSRVIYECDKTTGTYVAKTDTRSCEVPIVTLPTVYIGMGLVFIIIGAAALLFWQKERVEKLTAKEKPPAPAPPPPAPTPTSSGKLR